MWDPRFPEVAATRLQEQRTQAAGEAQIAARPGVLRRHLGAMLMRLGERLATPATPAGRPAPVMTSAR